MRKQGSLVKELPAERAERSGAIAAIMPSAGKIQICNSSLRLTTAKAVSVSGHEPLRLRAPLSIQMQENAMNRYLTIGLAILAGAALGAAAVQGLHAQAKPPAYSVTEVDVHDTDAYTKEFLPVVQPLVKKSGGMLIAGSFKVTAIRGTAPKRVAINRWESVETATAFYNSPEYKAALAIGEKYATFRQYALEGLPQ